MKKVIKISGMSCGHCSARVEKALKEFDGVTVSVDLKGGAAKVISDKDIPDSVLSEAICDLGFDVTEIIPE